MVAAKERGHVVDDSFAWHWQIVLSQRKTNPFVGKGGIGQMLHESRIPASPLLGFFTANKAGCVSGLNRFVPSVGIRRKGPFILVGLAAALISKANSCPDA